MPQRNNESNKCNKMNKEDKGNNGSDEPSQLAILATRPIPPLAPVGPLAPRRLDLDHLEHLIAAALTAYQQCLGRLVERQRARGGSCALHTDGGRDSGCRRGRELELHRRRGVRRVEREELGPQRELQACRHGTSAS